ncbi:hypothetical protein GQ600_23134 [Phytophthora cactorum]|nr:hypothetical protein GQ600_23134 [Phytophthora cactorum]
MVASSRNDEERMGVKEAVQWLWNAVKIRAKMKFWLFRGTTPEEVLEKLKVASNTDKNYKYYSKYFFKYYVKYPGRQPPNLPTRLLMGLCRLGYITGWRKGSLHRKFSRNGLYWDVCLGAWGSHVQVLCTTGYLAEKNLSPPQVFKKLGFTGTFDSARGDPNYKYFEHYSKMWSDLQVRLSQANIPAKSADEIMLEKLVYWLENNFSPPQVFKELGLTGTFASARGDPNYKYFEHYYKMWSRAQVR